MRVVRLLMLLAALSFLLTLRAEYMGEEAVYSLLSIEMHHSGNLLALTQYGQAYGRPPLFNWLINPVAAVLGWAHVLEAARLVTAVATLLTAGVAAWMARLCGLSRRGAEFAGLIFLTMAYSLFWYGWLSYSDALLGLFVLLSIAAGLAAVVQRRHAWLLLAGAALACGFLTKALTVYVFYAVAMLVLAMREKSWGFLLNWRSVLLHALALAAPVVWAVLGPHTAAQGAGMVTDIVSRMHAQPGEGYLQEVAGFSLDALKMLLPLSLVLPLLAWRTGPGALLAQAGPRVSGLLWIAGLNALPYLVFPGSNVRYIYPLTGLMAVAFAGMVTAGGPRFERVTVAVAGVLVALKVALALTWLPAYQHRMRDFRGVAQDIAQDVGDAPLYIDDLNFVGVSVGARLDILRLEQAEAPLGTPGPEARGFLVAREPEPGWSVAKRYLVGGHALFLLCRGAAC